MINLLWLSTCLFDSVIRGWLHKNLRKYILIEKLLEINQSYTRCLLHLNSFHLNYDMTDFFLFIYPTPSKTLSKARAYTKKNIQERVKLKILTN